MVHVPLINESSVPVNHSLCQDAIREVTHLERYIARKSAAQATIAPSQSCQGYLRFHSLSGVRQTVSVDMAINKPVPQNPAVNPELNSRLMHDSIRDYHDPMMGVHQANVV